MINYDNFFDEIQSYNDWKNELMFELISVCYNCHHNKIHKNELI